MPPDISCLLRLLLCVAAWHPPSRTALSIRELDLLLQQHLSMGDHGRCSIWDSFWLLLALPVMASDFCVALSMIDLHPAQGGDMHQEGKNCQADPQRDSDLHRVWEGEIKPRDRCCPFQGAAFYNLPKKKRAPVSDFLHVLQKLGFVCHLFLLIGLSVAIPTDEAIWSCTNLLACRREKNELAQVE